jgi:hypothetical protein
MALTPVAKAAPATPAVPGWVGGVVLDDTLAFKLETTPMRQLSGFEKGRLPAFYRFAAEQETSVETV